MLIPSWAGGHPQGGAGRWAVNHLKAGLESRIVTDGFTAAPDHPHPAGPWPGPAPESRQLAVREVHGKGAKLGEG